MTKQHSSRSAISRFSPFILSLGFFVQAGCSSPNGCGPGGATGPYNGYPYYPTYPYAQQPGAQPIYPSTAVGTPIPGTGAMPAGTMPAGTYPPGTAYPPGMVPPGTYVGPPANAAPPPLMGR